MKCKGKIASEMSEKVTWEVFEIDLESFSHKKKKTHANRLLPSIKFNMAHVVSPECIQPLLEKKKKKQTLTYR